MLLSFIGKLPGLAVRLSLVLTYLDWAISEELEPVEVGPETLARAVHMIEHYALPMARRSYASASISKPEQAARRLLDAIRKRKWPRFSSRDALRLDLKDLGSAVQMNAALTILEDGDAVRAIEQPPGPQGGRPARLYAVNPAVLASVT